MRRPEMSISRVRGSLQASK